MPCRLDEFLELSVCHRTAIHPEAIDGNPMRWSFFRIVLVRSHAEGAARYPDHVARDRAFGTQRRRRYGIALPEILAVSDRIVTMREGRVTGQIARNDATQEILMSMMTFHDGAAEGRARAS